MKNERKNDDVILAVPAADADDKAGIIIFSFIFHVCSSFLF